MADFLLRVRTSMRFDGPLFDARGRRAFRDLRDELEEEAAEFVLDHIQGTFHTHFKHPTGYYESNVRIKNSNEVWDGGMGDRKSTRLNSSHYCEQSMPSPA